MDHRLDGAVADRLEDGLLRAENWIRDRSSRLGVASATVIVACIGWWLVNPSASSPPVVDDLIPAVDQQPTPDIGAVASSESPGGSPVGSASDTAVDAPPRSPDSTQRAEPIVVHVIGAVRRPGLVSVEAPGRIGDALTAAGGITEQADEEMLNLAEPLVDGMQIRVPDRDEPLPGLDSASATSLPLVRRPHPDPPVSVAANADPVDLNRAGAVELEQLPGIGPTLARAIVAWRDDNGPFATVDDLQQVPGIGPVKLAGLRDVARV